MKTTIPLHSLLGIHGSIQVWIHRRGEVSVHTHNVKPTVQRIHSVKSTPVELSGQCQCTQEEAADSVERRKEGALNNKRALEQYKQMSSCLPSQQFIQSVCCLIKLKARCSVLAQEQNLSLSAPRLSSFWSAKSCKFSFSCVIAALKLPFAQVGFA